MSKLHTAACGTLRRTGMTTKTLVSCALLSALSVILARFIIPMPNATTRFSIEAVPILLAGYLFGPVAGALVGFVSDTAGCLFSGYGWNIVFSLPPVLYGLSAGLLRGLLRSSAGFFRVLFTALPAAALGSVLWQSYWLSAIYGSNTYLYYLGFRSIQFAVTIVADAAIITLLFRTGLFTRQGLWPPRAWAEKTPEGQTNDAE